MYYTVNSINQTELATLSIDDCMTDREIIKKFINYYPVRLRYRLSRKICWESYDNWKIKRYMNSCFIVLMVLDSAGYIIDSVHLKRIYVI